MNKWFAAHIVMYVEFKTESQTTFPVWENIVLINANSDDEAFGKAERKGLESEGDDGGSFEWEGLPARWVFAGVRKLTLCKNSEERPGDGTEITYIQMRVRSKNSLKSMPSYTTLPTGISILMLMQEWSCICQMGKRIFSIGKPLRISLTRVS